MSEEFVFEQKHKANQPLIDVIFIHGLTGDSVGTWTNENGDFWPVWLSEEHQNINVFTLGYPTDLLGKWANKEMTLYERAKSILEHLSAYGDGVGARPIVFITHSLGGLLAKQLIRCAKDSQDKSWQAIANMTKLVMFLGTPHTGAGLANLLGLLPGKPVSNSVDALSNSTGALNDLNEFYRSFAPKANIKTVAYYEKYKTKGSIIVVPLESADPSVADTSPIAIDADHLGICKPPSKKSTLYLSVSKHVKILSDSCVKNATPSQLLFDEEDYTEKHDTDRRDLQQKLIDANREHEYSHANDAQNKFAQQYYKHGLFTEEKSRKDMLLAEIEQRFKTHVYNTKICKNASEEEINQCLQEHVIDPIFKKYEGVKGITPKVIMNAIYYLTEQCHISWNMAS